MESGNYECMIFYPFSLQPDQEMAKVVEIMTYYNKAALLKAHEQTVMVKVTAPMTGKKATAPLDVVFVLDTSGSMAGDRIAKMKKAMAIAIQKMGDDDRIAVVPFSSEANKSKAKLQRVITEADKKEMQAFVEGLKAHANTNIRAGLQVAVDLLLARRADQEGRAGVIFLMSDGAQNHGDAGKVDVSKVNVQTFGFGEKHDPKVGYTKPN
jgi:secreted protein with Ig-like and vWFA domain